ncbi:unnamed protein product [Orchesella dallaii]|uniref:Uncharacterized protein n=1 Tax=Orchesella dallaii TaxID=48710 RepID=A0ABP1RNU4_9HEXA
MGFEEYYFSPFITSLSLDYGHMKISSVILKNLPVTLRKLTLFRGRHEVSCPDFGFQNRMESLEELRLIGPIVANLFLFLKDTPNLEILQICRDDTECYGDFPLIPIPDSLRQIRKKKMDGLPLFQVPPVIKQTDFALLQDLCFQRMKEFNVGMEFVPPHLITHLTSLMPNLKRLRIGLNDEGLAVVCANWKNLEALDIYPDALSPTAYTDAGRSEELKDLRLLSPKNPGTNRLENHENL